METSVVPYSDIRKITTATPATIHVCLVTWYASQSKGLNKFSTFHLNYFVKREVFFYKVMTG
jgi:hypothetical protein